MVETDNAEELSPRTLMRIVGDFANSQILAASLEYNFFSLIHGGNHCADELARAAGTDPRESCSTACLPGLVKKREGGYFLTAMADSFLVKGNRPLSPRRAGAMGRHGESQGIARPSSWAEFLSSTTSRPTKNARSPALPCAFPSTC